MTIPTSSVTTRTPPTHVLSVSVGVLITGGCVGVLVGVGVGVAVGVRVAQGPSQLVTVRVSVPPVYVLKQPPPRPLRQAMRIVACTLS